MGGKQRVLRPDRSAALLQAIGIMNADATISARNAKKYKQVNHLVELCRPTWEKLAANRTIANRTIDAAHPLRIVDLACGNSYLAFVLLEALASLGWFKGLAAEVERRAGPTLIRDLAHPATR